MVGVARADDPLQPIVKTVLGDRQRSCNDAGGISFGPFFSHSAKLEAIAQDYARHEGNVPKEQLEGYGTIKAFLGTGDPQSQAINAAYKKGAGAAIGNCAFKEYGVGFMRDDKREIDFVVIVVGTPTQSAGYGAVSGADRPGNDYRNFEIQPPTGVASEVRADLCEAACNGEASCKAWTYVNPGLQGRLGRCWLKNAVPAAVACSGCTSGVKRPGIQTNINFPGNDIDHFVVSDVAACQTACDKSSSCTTWTYVRPGVQGPQANCWLKKDFPAPVVDDCCTSGTSNAPPSRVLR